ncbi:hypothetical protein D1BOALGB6SA_3901 [Olavius sp. associated proteobacterium Delta 1]|nr:hypothetical protein D1BOALGB6SA_3901 [Olavius sp. associated proteobacterium Delta 1]
MSLTGIAIGAAGAWGVSQGLSRFGRNPARPPQLYEFYLDNYWFKSAGLDTQSMNPPLKGSRKADIVILGGGFTGLASAYHLAQKFPDRKIVLLEGACCGYGASGRNGGFVDTRVPGIYDYIEKAGYEKGRHAFDISLYGINLIKQLVPEYGLDCEFEENGSLVTAMDDKQARALERDCATFKAMGLEASIIQGPELEAQIKSPRYIAGLTFPYTGIVNPYKLARGMKALVEDMGVEILEKTVVMRFTPSVGQMGEFKNIYYGVAHNGEGVGNCQTAGRIIADLMAGEPSELTKLYYVNHKIPWAGPQKLRIIPARLYKWYRNRWCTAVS